MWSTETLKKKSRNVWKQNNGFKETLLLHNFKKGNKEIHINHLLLKLLLQIWLIRLEWFSAVVRLNTA